jgi:hypothetical protein
VKDGSLPPGPAPVTLTGEHILVVPLAGPRAALPWPVWVDYAVEGGTGWLGARGPHARLAARAVTRRTPAINSPDGGQIWVLTDTGTLQPGFSGASPEPGHGWTSRSRSRRTLLADSPRSRLPRAGDPGRIRCSPRFPGRWG